MRRYQLLELDCLFELLQLGFFDIVQDVVERKCFSIMLSDAVGGLSNFIDLLVAERKSSGNRPQGL